MTDKVKKTDISKGLNKLFGLEIDWSKMSQKDLDTLVEKLDKTDEVIKIFFNKSPDKRNTLMELSRSRVESVVIEQGTKLYKTIDSNRLIFKFIQGLTDNKEKKVE